MAHTWVLGLLLVARSLAFVPVRHHRWSKDLYAKGRGQKEREGAPEAPAPLPLSEFSRRFTFAQLRTARTIKLSPVAAEMKELCKRFGVDDIVDMRVEVITTGISDDELAGAEDCLKVKGLAEATVLQTCSESGGKVTSGVFAPFECVLVPRGCGEAQASALSDKGYDFEEFDAAGEVDLGEIAAQYLCLDIDPYPVTEDVKGKWEASSSVTYENAHVDDDDDKEEEHDDDDNDDDDDDDNCAND